MPKQPVSLIRLPLSFYLQVFICAALWGSAFPVIKNSYAGLDISSYGEQLVFAGSRFLLAGLMVHPFCRGAVVTKLKQAPIVPLVAVVLGQTYFQYLFFYYGLSSFVIISRVGERPLEGRTIRP